MERSSFGHSRIPVEFSLKKSFGDFAVVTRTEEYGPPEDVDFVRVEGKWIPRSLEEYWTVIVEELNAAMAA